MHASTWNKRNLVSANCSIGYMHNPYSNTCVRLVQIYKSWYDAKSYCEAAGEHLATFNCIHDAAWLRMKQLEGMWLETAQQRRP